MHAVAAEDYAEQVRFVGLFLEGKSDELLDDLRQRMQEAAGRLAFERAATLRDQVRALESVLESQRVVLDTLIDQDVLGFYREGQAVEIAVQPGVLAHDVARRFDQGGELRAGVG